MAFVLVQGGIKSEPTIIKIKPELENTVEICMDDILYSSDEENVQNIETQDVENVGNKIYTKKENIFKSSCNNKRSNKKNNEVSDGKDEDSDEDEQNGCEDFNAVANLQTDEQLVLNFSNDLEGGIQIMTQKSVSPNPYRTFQHTDIQEDMKKVEVTKAPFIKIAPHEYTTLAFDKHICNYCQCAFRNIKQLKKHIRKQHRELTTMYQCPYCPYKSKWQIKSHIISKHKDDKDIQWFRCHVCDMKVKLKSSIASHCLTHLTPGQMQDRMQTCPVCKKEFKNKGLLKRHVKFVHNKAAKIKNCDHCDFSTFIPTSLRRHVEEYHSSLPPPKTYKCTKCNFTARYKYRLAIHLKRHDLRWVCEICSFATSSAQKLKRHQLSHKKKIDDRDLKYRCNKCDYKTYRLYSFKVHLLNHLKPHEIQYFYCYHCDFKAKRKDNLKTHVLRHFKKEEIPFQCFICDFSTKKRQFLIKHIDKHSTKFEKNTSKAQNTE